MKYEMRKRLSTIVARHLKEYLYELTMQAQEEENSGLLQQAVVDPLSE